VTSSDDLLSSFLRVSDASDARHERVRERAALVMEFQPEREAPLTSEPDPAPSHLRTF